MPDGPLIVGDYFRIIQICCFSLNLQPLWVLRVVELVGERRPFQLTQNQASDPHAGVYNPDLGIEEILVVAEMESEALLGNAAEIEREIRA